MKSLFAGILLAVALATTQVAAQVDIREEQIQFPKGASSTTLKGSIKGYHIVDYRLRANAGQTIAVNFKPSNPSAYFNVTSPGSDTAIFVGSTSGSRFEGRLPADGVYTIRVYLMRNAARRDESSQYMLEVLVR